MLKSKHNNNHNNHNQNVNYYSSQQNHNLIVSAEQNAFYSKPKPSTNDRNLITASFDNYNRKFDDLTDCNDKNYNCAYSSISANAIDAVDLNSVDDGFPTGTQRKYVHDEHISNLSDASTTTTTTTAKDNSFNRQIIVCRIRKVSKPIQTIQVSNLPTTRGRSFYDSLVLCIKYIIIQLTGKLSTLNTTRKLNSKTTTKMGFLRSMKLKERIVMSFAASLVLFTLFLVIDVQMDFGMTSKHLLPSSSSLASHDKVRYVQNEDNTGFMRDFKRKFLQKR